jgi:hypothetical protein
VAKFYLAFRAEAFEAGTSMSKAHVKAGVRLDHSPGPEVDATQRKRAADGQYGSPVVPTYIARGI